ncbi:MAG: dihydroneopterin aldolase [Flammeovirgaceae bacterium]|nr:dihydroneopterin aldolase [Flammeovirgaceae bacterium]
MGKIKLDGIEFFAYHGFYKSERQVGRKFGVDLEVSTDFTKAAEEDSLEETINYEDLYKTIKTEMENPVHLLEFLANNICKKILELFPNVIEVTITLKKYNPPIGGICHSAGVTLSRSREAI